MPGTPVENVQAVVKHGARVPPGGSEWAKQAVLLLAHGTPETVEQIPEYLRNVVSGRPVPQAVVEEIQHRYALIGKSPLTEITMAQARLVEAELRGERTPRRKQRREVPGRMWACGIGSRIFRRL